MSTCEQLCLQKFVYFDNPANKTKQNKTDTNRFFHQQTNDLEKIQAKINNITILQT